MHNRPFTSERVQRSGSGHVPFLWFRWGWGKEKVWFRVLFEINVFYSMRALPAWLTVCSVFSEKQLSILLETGQGQFEAGSVVTYIILNAVHLISIPSFPYIKFQ